MPSRYTAQEMREMADFIWRFTTNSRRGYLYIPDGLVFNVDDATAMLRQASDDLGRERRYEYGVKVTDIQDKNICGIYKCSDLQNAKELAEDVKDHERIVTVVRRELVDWEEVPNV